MSDIVEGGPVELDTELDGDLEEELLVLEEVEQAAVDLVLPVWEPTGEPRVDEALDELTRLDPDDVHQHAPVYAEVHERLRDALSNLDTPS